MDFYIGETRRTEAFIRNCLAAQKEKELGLGRRGWRSGCYD
jgi:hypothetical protein